MNYNKNGKLSQIEKHKKAAFDGEMEDLLTKFLNSDRCQTILSECREFRERIFTPFKTIITFIKQVLSPDKSCKKAVAGVVVENLNTGTRPISSNTGPYCKGRQRLPVETVRNLVNESGNASIKNAAKEWKPYGRELKVFDGTTVKMPDTKENQAFFLQHTNQKEGAGFPIARLLVVMSLTVGTIIDYSLGPCKGKGTGEHSLLRNIFGCIHKEDIVLGDRYFPSFFVLTELKKIGADGIFHAPSQRNYDFRTGKKLEKNDHVVSWKKPERPDWMDKKSYDACPTAIEIREFKISGKIYITTLLDNKKYSKKELSTIYRRRWDIEVTLNSIKTIMGMDMLSCKTPEMIKKEIGVHFLAYNFIRIIMTEACMKHGARPWTVSFKGTIQLLNEFMPYFLNSNEKKNKIMYAELLKLIIKNRIGNRPGRLEPRMVKKRPKYFPVLQRPRIIEKKRLIRKLAKKILKETAA